MWHIQQIYAFLLFWIIFGEIHGELLFLVKKVTISERITEILRKFVFLIIFEKGKILRKIWVCLNKCFLSNQKNGEILTKTWFLLYVIHIHLNYAFLLFGSIFLEILRELLFLVKNLTISERITKILRKFVLINMFEKGKCWRKFVFV